MKVMKAIVAMIGGGCIAAVVSNVTGSFWLGLTAAAVFGLLVSNI